MVATDASLDFAEQVAKLAGLPFDRDQVRADAASLEARLFGDVCKLTGLSSESFRFEAGAYFHTRIFAALDDRGRNTIALDRTFEYWISCLCLLSAVATFEEMTEPELAQLCSQVDRTLNLFVEGSSFDRSREEMKTYLVRYAHLLNISEALARAMLVFALCHEIAHHMLGHLSAVKSRGQEFEADKMALGYFFKIVSAGNAARSSTAYIDPKVAGAPLILTELIVLLDEWHASVYGGMPNDGGDHPGAAERLDRLKPMFEGRLNETALQVVRGFDAGIGDLRAMLTAR
ncbi:MAG: hypothetical protein RIC52_05135 [Amphiplicatus sp.]